MEEQAQFVELPTTWFLHLQTAALILDTLEDEGVADWSGYGKALATAMDAVEEMKREWNADGLDTGV